MFRLFFSFFKADYLNIKIFHGPDVPKTGLFKILLIAPNRTKTGIFKKCIEKSPDNPRETRVTEIEFSAGFQNAEHFLPKTFLVWKMMVRHAGSYNVH